MKGFIRYASLFLGLILLTCWGASCGGDDMPEPEGDLVAIPYDPTPYTLAGIPYFFPDMVIPQDNPLTEEGIELGRFIFFDPVLSQDSTVACASCHQAEKAFTDGQAFSTGIFGEQTNRSAMSLANVGFYNNGLFWDGRFKKLENLALHPITDPIEMANTLEAVEQSFRNHPEYPAMFRRAFGVEDRSEISREHIGKALAQFMRIMISAESKFDYAFWDRGAETRFFTASELRGKNLFFTEPPDQSEDHPGCSHCHNLALVTTNEYMNNGLTEALNLNDFPDIGHGAITGNVFDNGKFRVPTLRNLAFTAPYMHDGRFETLDEVLDHYASGGHYAENVDANIAPFTLSQQQRDDLKAFLLTMTDSVLVNNPELQNPFE